MDFRQVVDSLKQERSVASSTLQRLDQAIAVLEGSTATEVKKPKRFLSAAARKRISNAQRKRWARARAIRTRSTPKQLHWTQRPENRKRLAKVIRMANRARQLAA